MKHQMSFKSVSHQAGVSLIIVLLLLLIITLLGLASLRGVLMEERMTASQADRGLSFQAAEQALRLAEEVASGHPVFPTAGNCVAGLCPPPVSTDTDRWDVAATWTGTASAVVNLGTINAAETRYIIEWMRNPGRPDGRWPDNADDCTVSGDVSAEATCNDWSQRYRISVRSVEAGRSAVILQSSIVAP
jgi:type IV pilus assembly protein PilX